MKIEYEQSLTLVSQEFVLEIFPAHELHEWTRTSNPLVCVITPRQQVLSANDTNAIRMIGGLKRFVIFVIARAILRVMKTATSYQFRANSCNSWLNF